MKPPACGPSPPMAGRHLMKGREMEHDEWIDAAMHEPTPDDAAPYAWAGALAVIVIGAFMGLVLLGLMWLWTAFGGVL